MDAIKMEGRCRFLNLPYKRRRIRKPNFTDLETSVLTQEFEKRKHILRHSSVTGPPPSSESRRQAWTEITDALNKLHPSYRRSISEVQKKVQNMAHLMRRDIKQHSCIRDASQAADEFDIDRKPSPRQLEATEIVEQILEPPALDEICNDDDDTDDCSATIWRNRVIGRNSYESPVTTQTNSATEHKDSDIQRRSSLSDTSSSTTNFAPSGETIGFHRHNSEPLVIPTVRRAHMDSQETTSTMNCRDRQEEGDCSQKARGPNENSRMGSSLYPDDIHHMHRELLVLQKEIAISDKERIDLEKQKLKLEIEKLQVEKEKLLLEKIKLSRELRCS